MPSTTKPEVQNLFQSLVENALDFLRSAVDELEQKPKYSIIHYVSGVEILLKARLLYEHWALIVSSKNPNFAKLKNGEQNTIGMPEAISLLESILNVNFTREQKQSFDNLREQRNRYIHFLPSNNEEELEAITAYQLRSWYYLYSFIMEDWKDVFTPFAGRITELDRLLHANKKYLNEKFRLLSDKMADIKKEGGAIIPCSACTYQSLQINLFDEPKYEGYGECLVCGYEVPLVRVECSLCQTSHYFEDESTLGEERCESCGEMFEIKSLIDQGFDLATIEWLFPIDEIIVNLSKYSNDLAYCISCGYDVAATVLKVNGILKCVRCGEAYDHDSLFECGWCGEQIATYFDHDTLSFGCGVRGCGGAYEHNMSKND